MGRVVSRGEIVVRLAKVVALALGDLGLTENQYRALTLVDEGAPALREFAVRLAMKPPNVTTLIDGLVQRNLVSRHRDEHDRRRIALALTPTGRRLLDQADERANLALTRVASFDRDHEHRLPAGIDDWQRALEAVAVDLRNNLRKSTAPTGSTRAVAR